MDEVYFLAIDKHINDSLNINDPDNSNTEHLLKALQNSEPYHAYYYYYDYFAEEIDNYYYPRSIYS